MPLLTGTNLALCTRPCVLHLNLNSPRSRRVNPLPQAAPRYVMPCWLASLWHRAAARQRAGHSAGGSPRIGSQLAQTTDDRQQTTVGGTLGPGCLGPPRAATRAMHLGMQTFVAHSICWMRVLAICPCDLYSCLRAWGLGCACIVCACARCADVYSRLTSIHVCLRLYKRMCLQSKHMTRIVWLTLVHQSARRPSSYSVQTEEFDVVG